MTQTKSTYGIEAFVYGDQDNTVSTTIPSTMKGGEIKNYLTFSHKMNIPEGACVIMRQPLDDKWGRYRYRIIDEDSNMIQYASTHKNFQIILYPKNIMVKIHCADGRICIREYPSTTPAGYIVENVCKDIFRLKHDIAYALYRDMDSCNYPIPQTKSIIEYDPYLEDVWLLRRFWVMAESSLRNESDIHFSYSHAKKIFFSEGFHYQYYRWEELVAISLTIEHTTYELTKAVVIKEKKDKLKSRKEEKKKGKIEKKEKLKEKKKARKAGMRYFEDEKKPEAKQPPNSFPLWMNLDRKIKKRKLELVEKVKPYENIDKLELKRKFLSICLENKYFGCLMIPVRCKIPITGKEEKDYTLCFTELKIHLLAKDTETEVYNVGHLVVKKWKPISYENMQFHIMPNGYDTTNIFEWNIYSQNSITIVDYYTAFVIFIKEQSIANTKDDISLTTKKDIIRQDMTSLDDILNTSGLNTKFYNDDEEIESDDDYKESNVLSRIRPPKQQPPSFLDISKITVAPVSKCVFADYCRFYDGEIGFSYDPLPLANKDNNIIESGCSLLKHIISQESISPVADGIEWVQTCLPEDLLAQSVLGWQLQMQTNNLFEMISSVSRCISYVFHFSLTPLDSFIALNFSRSLLLHYCRQLWKSTDFNVMAEQVDETLGDVLRPVLNITRRLIFPLSSLVFDVSSDTLPAAKSMLYLNESVAMSLLFSAVAIARALCDAGIGADAIQPILNKMPLVKTYDPVLAYALSDILLPILNTLGTNEVAQKALLSQAHVAKLDLMSISTSITELYNYSHFMESPIALFCKIRSPRLLTTPETPSTVTEAGYVYQIAKESAFTLWNLGSGKHRALAQQISYTAVEFYAVFIEAASDESLANHLGLLFHNLVTLLTKASEIFGTFRSMSDVLDEFNPVHSIVLTILNSDEQKTGLAMLALDAVSAKHRMDILDDSGHKIDVLLRNFESQNSPEEMKSVSDSFRIFSLMVISLSKGTENDLPLRAKLNEFGNGLVTLLNDDKLSIQQKRNKAQELINMQRGFIAVGKESGEATQQIIKTNKFIGSVIPRFTRTTVIAKQATFETNVQITKPDVSVNTEILKKIAAVLGKFAINTATQQDHVLLH